MHLYQGPEVDGPSAALVRYQPGARTQRHLHPGYELIFVLDGVLHNDAGAHPAGTLEVCPPDSEHALWSDEGCTFLVVWEKPVRSRFPGAGAGTMGALNSGFNVQAAPGAALAAASFGSDYVMRPKRVITASGRPPWYPITARLPLGVRQLRST